MPDLVTFLPDFEWAKGVGVAFLIKLIKALVALVFGWILIWFLVRVSNHFASKRLTVRVTQIITKCIRYLGMILLAFVVLRQLGVNVGALLGAAGVVGIGIGFAAQTSLSNVISGLFILGERHFEIGDVIEADGITGTVDNVGLLSLTLRTFDNRSIRIPNETLVKNKVVNITRHPIRRFNLNLSVSYAAKIPEVIALLKKAAEDHPGSLEQPEPIVMFDSFGDSGINFFMGAWCLQADYLELKNSLPALIMRRLEEAEIEIPYPHHVLTSSPHAQPLRVSMEESS